MVKCSMPLDNTPLDDMPGHGIRRLQQIAVALFMQETEGTGLTPVQFAVMQALHDCPGLDQKTLAQHVSFDTSTIGAVIDRLEAKHLLTRSLSAQDRRVRLLHLTSEGHAQLTQSMASVQRVQSRILEPLDAVEQAQFCSLLKKLCARSHNEEPVLNEKQALASTTNPARAS
jgi:DNA-binding MarR family transcriptional regulator